MTDLLTRLVDTARQTVAQRRAAVSEQALERQALAVAPVHRGLEAALRARPGVAVMAEIKRASPSRGAIRPDLDPAEWARRYCRGGASAISVLTEPEHFQGSLSDLQAARACGLPLLRKDFIVERYQLLEARLHGAAAVLLIAAALPADRLRQLHDEARRLGLDALVELHDDEDVAKLEAAFPDGGPALVGVNQRNLHTLEKDPDRFARMAGSLPGDALKVAESGISRPNQLAGLAELGYRAVLVGTALTTAANPLARLLSLSRAGALAADRPLVKVCGLTREADVEAAAEAGADFVGLVLWAPSARAVTPRQAARLVARLPATTRAVGVFVDEDVDTINRLAQDLDLAAVQLHGREPPELPGRLCRPTWKATRLGTGGDDYPPERYPDAFAMLLDAHVPGLPGGTGQSIDDAALMRLVPQLRAAGQPWVLAGGLTPDNVARLVATWRPWAVDVSSGVEKAPGHKDPARIRDFIAAIRSTREGT